MAEVNDNYRGRDGPAVHEEIKVVRAQSELP